LGFRRLRVPGFGFRIDHGEERESVV
jgi:hypothetical protein